MEQIQGVLSLGLKSMQQDMSRMDRIAVNLANALTPGYKREFVVAKPFGNIVSDLASINVDIKNSTPLSAHADLRPGSLKSTGQSLDFAISGSGYFEVMTDNGPVYTRQGNFRVDAQGRLTSMQGFPVMGHGGEIYLSSSTPTVDISGHIQDGVRQGPLTSALSAASAVSKLKIVNFDQPRSLQRIGDGFLIAEGPITIMNDAEVKIRQGFLENSNVSSMQEMVQMTQTMRHFESMHKVVMGYDEMVGLAIRKLGELS